MFELLDTATHHILCLKKKHEYQYMFDSLLITDTALNFRNAPYRETFSNPTFHFDKE